MRAEVRLGVACLSLGVSLGGTVVAGTVALTMGDTFPLIVSAALTLAIAATSALILASSWPGSGQGRDG